MSAYGTYEEIEGRPAIRFERLVRHPVAKVWRAVSEPDGLARWFPAGVAFEGRAVTFTFADSDEESAGEVRVFDPPHRLEFTWERDVLRFELSDADDGASTRLVFTHVIDDRDGAARTAAGWHVCLGLLESSLDGAGTTGPTSEPTGEWQAHYDAYRSRGVPSGAPIPGR